jgi:hypothetical protein
MHVITFLSFEVNWTTEMKFIIHNKLLTRCLRLFDTFLRCVNTCNNVYYIHKTEWTLEGSSNCCNKLHFCSSVNLERQKCYGPVSYGILNPVVNWLRGQFSSMVYWTPLLKTDPPCMVNWTPMVFLPPPISNQEIGREVKIPRVRGSKFHG